VAESALSGLEAIEMGAISTSEEEILQPRAYLTLLFTRLPQPGTVEHFEVLLSWNVKAELAPGAHRAR
jgi:hypothetical protein